MNQMYLLGGGFLVFLGVTFAVAAARSKSASSGGRARSIGLGAALLLAGLLLVLFGIPREGISGPILGTVVGALIVGIGVGMWSGHMSGRSARL